MNGDRLAEWLTAEAEKASSFRQLALSLGTSSTTVNALRKKERKTLSDDLLQAIALRRKESVVQTAEWLGVEAPVVFDLPKKINEIESRMAAMEEKLEYAFQRLSQQDEAAPPSDVLNIYLLEHSINVRQQRTQETIRAELDALAAEPGTFERLLLVILGVLPLPEGDRVVMAQLLKRLTGQPWTPGEVVRVINQVR